MRILKQIGFVRSIIMFGLIIFLITLLNTKLRIESSRTISFVLFATVMFFINIKRKDAEFIKLYFASYYIVFLLDNLILSIPFIIILIYHSLWLYLFIYIIYIVIISFFHIQTNKRTVNTLVQRHIPDANFEWKSGFRRNLVTIILLWAIGFVFSFYIASVPIVIFLLGTIILNFYEKGESVEVLLAKEYGTKEFLRDKLLSHLRDFSLFLLPLVIVFLIFHLEYYYIILAEIGVFLLLLTYSISLKYTFYEPNEKSGAMQTFMAFGILSIFVPFLLPVTVILTVIFVFRAIKNLKFYLDDFN